MNHILNLSCRDILDSELFEKDWRPGGLIYFMHPRRAGGSHYLVFFLGGGLYIKKVLRHCIG